MCSNAIYPRNPTEYNGPRVTDTKTFIAKAVWVHGDRYDYSPSVYQGAKVKCKIFCPNHNGCFEISPTNHTSGKGCNVCTNKVRITREEFVRRSSERHNNLYDYSEVEYRGSQTPVTIICPEHGPFVSSPSHHMAGRRCKFCAAKHTNDNKRLTLEAFESKGRETHGNQYDYISYTSYSSPAQIRCRRHGIFYQTAQNHIAGKGCPECASERKSSYSSLSDEILDGFGRFYHVRFVREDESTFDKIGITCKSIKERFSAIGMTGLTMKVLFEWTGTYRECIAIEENILRSNEQFRFKVHDLRGTPLGGWTECFPSGTISVEV